MKTKFHRVKPGEKITLQLTKGRCVWSIKCCGCGLEHIVLLVPKKTKILVGAWRTDDLPSMTLPKSHVKQHKKRPMDKRKKVLPCQR